MVKAISGLAGTSKNSFTIGNGQDGYKYILANNDLAFAAGIRYNDIVERWEFSNDGYTWETFGSGDGYATCCPGYLGDDGYVLGMVSGSPDWIPNNIIANNKLVVGNNTETVVGVELKTFYEDAVINYDGYNKNIYLITNDGIRDVVMTEYDDAATIIFGDYSNNLITFKINTLDGDGYIYYNNDTESLTTVFPNQAGESKVLATEPGNLNNILLGDGTTIDTSVQLQSSAADAYVKYNGYDEYISVTISGKTRYSMLVDGYQFNTGGMFYYDGVDHTELAIGNTGQVLVAGSIPTWSNDISLPDGATRTITQEANTASVDGYTFTIKAQDAASNYDGAPLYLEGGDSDSGGDGYGGAVALIPGINLGSGRNGNIFLQSAPASIHCNNMENGIYVAEATAIPDGYDDLSGTGGYLYSTSGAFVWKSGVSGTETTMGPGCPHCPKCGRDFATSWSNDGETLSICMWCLTDTLKAAGIDENQFIIKKGRK